MKLTSISPHKYVKHIYSNINMQTIICKQLNVKIILSTLIFKYRHVQLYYNFNVLTLTCSFVCINY
jgi:hypothetical protein